MLLQRLWIVGLVGSAYAGKSRILTKRQELESFDWSAVTPSADIEYHDCYDGLQCARLSVPMDWTKHNTTEGLSQEELVAIAIVKIPAAVSEDDPSFGGPIIYNPGGPGDSGVEYARAIGTKLQSLFDGEKHFEIIGFDPRGVGATTPPIRCYKDESKQYDDMEVQLGLPSVDSGPVGLRYNLQTFKAYWDICLKANNTIFRHAATASVARDVLGIADRIEASRERHANSSAKVDKEEAMIQYYGTSYGTYLGATIASLFPDRVALMALDSVVDAEDWSNGRNVGTFDHLDGAIDVIWDHCFSIKEECPLWQKTDRSGLDIKTRVLELMEDLQASPAGVGIRDSINLLTPALINNYLLPTSYFVPEREWILNATLSGLSYVLAGDYGAWFYPPGEEELPEPGCEAEAFPQTPSSPEDSFHVVRCIESFDLDGSRERNVSWAEDIVDAFVRQSPASGGYVAASWPLRCYGLPKEFKPSFVFQGPFGASAPDTTSNSSTVAPVLFVNNRLDPVAPLSAAYRLSRFFEGSSVVIQEAAGHVTNRLPNECLARIFQAYFNDGLMPENGTVCQPDVVGLPALSIA